MTEILVPTLAASQSVAGNMVALDADEDRHGGVARGAGEGAGGVCVRRQLDVVRTAVRGATHYARWQRVDRAGVLGRRGVGGDECEFAARFGCVGPMLWSLW